MNYFEAFLSMEGYCWWEDAATAALLLAKYYYTTDENKFMEYLLKAIKIDSTKAEPYYYMGIFYSDRQRWEQAIPWYTMASQVKPASDLMSPLMSYEKGFSTWLPCMQLCLCYNGLGKIKEAYDWNEKAISFGVKDSKLFHNREVFRQALPSLAIESVQPMKQKHEGLFKNVTDGKGKRLNLGCGNKRMPGFENADNFKADFVDAVYNLYDIPYEDGTIAEIHSEHALEHVGKVLGERAIKEWARVLKPGGLLHLKIPDFDLCISDYLTSSAAGAATTVNGYPAKEWYKYTIFGIQKSQAGEADQSQYHTWGYSKNEIRELLEAVGFVIDHLENYDGWGTPSIEIRARMLNGPVPVKKNTKKVGWWYPEDWDFGPVRIRALNTDKWLKAQGYKSEIISNIGQGFLCDVVVVGSDFSAYTLQGIKELKQRGIRVICNLCEELHYEAVYDTLKECETIVCCSTKLAEWAKQYNPNVSVIEDAYEE
jgi:predicted SAM-dependent methyltransferase